MSPDMICPYCEGEVEVCHDDGFGYSEDEKHEQECPHCEKTFVFTTTISFYYEPAKSDCLNDGEHNFKEVKVWGYPEPRIKKRCVDCDFELEPEKLK